METLLPKLAEYGGIFIVVAILFFILWQIICWVDTITTTHARIWNGQDETETINWIAVGTKA